MRNVNKFLFILITPILPACNAQQVMRPIPGEAVTHTAPHASEEVPTLSITPSAVLKTLPPTVSSAYITPTISPEYIRESYNTEEWSHYIRNAGIITKGTDSNLWFGMSNGLWSFDGTQWEHFPREEKEDEYWNSGLAIAPNGTVWYSLNSEGVSSLTDGVWQDFPIDLNISDNTVWSVATSPDNNAWVGTRFSAYKYDGLSWSKLTGSEGEAPEFTLSMVADPEGSMWFGDVEGVVRYFDGETWSVFPPETYLENVPLGLKAIGHMQIGPDGALWFSGTQIGVVHFDGITWEVIPIPARSDAGVRDYPFVVSSEGDLWISTIGGFTVSRYRDGNWTVFENMPFLYVRDIEEGPDGAIWFATDNGIYRYMSSD
ncbi:MAG: hypothetical protein DWQ07_04555 [Chloroflexi bacterium]|nr:MAG: hypothetical protein DWQ07_04555 [Chloroflexota bacterium]MBL1194701.1 hypothetical protein [Chloroflexota bacterium]NOH11994.1 hypothetical protein [Chloroflexota bacterium]